MMDRDTQRTSDLSSQLRQTAENRRKRIGFGLLILLLMAGIYARAPHFMHGVSGDGYYHYIYLVSLFEDGDFDFSNQYEKYGNPYDLRKANKFPPGSALIWLPSYTVTYLYTLLKGRTPVDPFAPRFQRGVMSGTLFAGLLTLLLCFSFLRRFYPPRWVLLALFGIALATPFYHYMVYEPSYAHVPSAFTITLFFTLLFRRPEKPILLGLAAALATLVKFQNGLLLPIFFLYFLIVKRKMIQAFLFALAGTLPIIPILFYWHWAYGRWVFVPQGSTYMTSHLGALPHLLFASRHGALVWSPILWPALIGIVVLTFRRGILNPNFALLFFWGILIVDALPVDWWAGVSFGARRLVDLTPFFCLGLVESLALLEMTILKRSRRAAILLVSAIVIILALVNFKIDRAWLRIKIPHNRPIESTRIYGNGFAPIYRILGNPLAWPESLPFALRYGVHPRLYDLIVGDTLNFDDESSGPTLDPYLPEQRRYFFRGFTFDGGVRIVRRRAEIWIPLGRPSDLKCRLLLDGGRSPVPFKIFFNNKRITDVRDYAFDRIVTFRVKKEETHYGTNVLSLIFERSPERVTFGLLRLAPMTREFRELLPHAWIDSVALNEDGSLTVTGWAAGRRGKVDAEILLFPGHTRRLPIQRFARDDVKRVYPQLQETATAGFLFRYQPVKRPEGRAPIVLTISEEGGLQDTRMTLVTPITTGGSAPDNPP